MNSKMFLASVLAMTAVSAHADPRGMAVPVISCKSAHISIVIYKATCRTAPREDAPICQASVAVGQNGPVTVSVIVNQGAIRPFNVPTLLFRTSQSGPAVVDFRGRDQGGNGTYTGVGGVEIPGARINTSEDMACGEPQHQQGQL